MALQQSVVLYPLSLIYYILPYPIAFNIFLILHVSLGGFFVYLLSKHWGFREAPALVAAATFMFSGYVLSVLNLATTLSSIIWLPLILLFLDKALAGGAVKHIYLASLFLGIMFLGGEPSIFYSTLWILLFYSIFFWSENKKRLILAKVLKIYLLTALFGVLIASVQLVPFLELMRFADRSTSDSATYELLTKWSVPIKDTLNFLIPQLTRTHFGGDSYQIEQNWAYLTHTGIFAVLLVSLSIFSIRNWRIRFLFFLAALFLLISYGKNTPFHYLAYKFVPGFKFIRYPVRFLYGTTFAVSVLCGAGYQVYSDKTAANDGSLNNFSKGLLFILYICAIIFLILNLYDKKFSVMALDFCVKHLDPKRDSGVLACLLVGIYNVRRFLGFFVTGGLLLYLGSRLRIRARIINFAFVSLVIADLLSSGSAPGMSLTLDKKTVHSLTPNIEFLKKDESLFRFFVSPNTRRSYDILRDYDTYENAIYNCKDSLTANWPMLFGLYDAVGYDSIGLKNNLRLISLIDTSGSPSETKVLNMLNVKYIITKDKINAKGYRLVNKGIETYIYENVNVMSRASLVGAYKVLKNEMDVAEAFKSKEFDPAKTVILEEEPITGYGLRVTGYEVNEEYIEIAKYSPNEVVIKTQVYSPKFLVLSDTYYPGWKAYVDGKRDKIYRADYILRAVYLNPGEHTVRFVFDPFTFKLGLFISLSTLLFVLIRLLKRPSS